MAQFQRFIAQLSWGLGLLSMVAAVTVKLAHLEEKLTVTGHTLFLVAGAFFLCALATRDMERSKSFP
jgi:multidrug transporter EmrE-like cation transporter